MDEAAIVTNWQLDIPAGNRDPSSYYATPTPSEQTVTMTIEQAGTMYRQLGELLGGIRMSTEHPQWFKDVVAKQARESLERRQSGFADLLKQFHAEFHVAEIPSAPDSWIGVATEESAITITTDKDYLSVPGTFPNDSFLAIGVGNIWGDGDDIGLNREQVGQLRDYLTTLLDTTQPPC